MKIPKVIDKYWFNFFIKPKKSINKYDKKQLKIGILIELEHTNIIEIACIIAMNHLDENINYYKYLVLMEKIMQDV